MEILGLVQVLWEHGPVVMELQSAAFAIRHRLSLVPMLGPNA
jgi:hypothetical protein